MQMESRSRALDKIYKRRDRYEIPDWQRGEVWTEDKRRSLIDTILRGWHLPKFYFLKTGEDPEEFEVVDGQQRLTAILDFFDNELSLSRESAERVGGATYRELPDSASDAFDDFEIEFDEISDATEEEIKEFFQRLQQGLPLTSSEKLNASPGNLRDFAASRVEHQFLAEKIGVRNHRHAHFDIVAKALALEIDGLDVGLRYDDLRAVFEAQRQFSDSSGVATRFDSVLDFLDGAFPAREKRFRNRTITQSFITLAAALVEHQAHSGYEGAFREFFDEFMKQLAAQVELGQGATDPDYVQFQRTVNANIKAGPRLRQRILLRKLIAFNPSVVAKLGAAEVASAGLDEAIKHVAEDIARLVTTINEAYAAKHGKDLFKATNRTASALVALAHPISAAEDYETLIDNLYFLVWEGPGQRLDDAWPESFSDVNALRTALRHDLDHGSSSKVSRKRRDTANAFEKYAGTGTPDTVGPNVLRALQANLLSAVRDDMKPLLDKVHRKTI